MFTTLTIISLVAGRVLAIQRYEHIRRDDRGCKGFVVKWLIWWIASSERCKMSFQRLGIIKKLYSLHVRGVSKFKRVLLSENWPTSVRFYFWSDVLCDSGLRKSFHCDAYISCMSCEMKHDIVVQDICSIFVTMWPRITAVFFLFVLYLVYWNLALRKWKWSSWISWQLLPLFLIPTALIIMF